MREEEGPPWTWWLWFLIPGEGAAVGGAWGAFSAAGDRKPSPGQGGAGLLPAHPTPPSFSIEQYVSAIILEPFIQGWLVLSENCVY